MPHEAQANLSLGCLIQGTLGGAMGIRTPDLLNAIEALYQLSYDPKCLIRETMKASVMEVRK